VRVPSKSERTVRGPAPLVRTITAGAAGSGDFDAAAVLQAAHRKYLRGEDAVRSPGDATPQDPVDLGEVTLRNPTGKVHKYAGFAASIVWQGKWTHRVCGGNATLGAGTWRTFSAVKLSGYAFCPSSRHSAPSAGAKACKQGWD
jgi:hypothetical protein